MTRDEIVTALRCHCDAIETGKCPKDKCPAFERPARYKCAGVVCGEAADLFENQQRHIEALLQANAALRDTVLRRDAQIEKMSANLLEAKNTANQHAAINDTLYDSNAKLAADRKVLKNELCQYCGKYKYAHEGACVGCRWRDM